MSNGIRRQRLLNERTPRTGNQPRGSWFNSMNGFSVKSTRVPRTSKDWPAHWRFFDSEMKVWRDMPFCWKEAL